MSNTTFDPLTIAPAVAAGAVPKDHASARKQESLVLPLIVGVTGHRDLRAEDVPQLEAMVRKIFDEIQQQMPHTPLVVVSALAEGADRLVARIALERGHRLVAPLPMTPKVYATDFATQESQDEFHELLGQAEPSFVVSEDRV